MTTITSLCLGWLLASNALAAAQPGEIVPVADLMAQEGVPQAPVLVVNVWASWCGPCRAELPLLDALDERLDDSEARVVALNVDRTSRRGEAVVRHLGLTLPVVYDAPATYVGGLSPTSLPATFVLRSDGTVLDVVEGELDAAAIEQLEERVVAWSRADAVATEVAGTR